MPSDLRRRAAFNTRVTRLIPPGNRRRDRRPRILPRMDGIDPGNGNTALRGDPRVVAIVGAGFCGTALAIQLLRRAADTPLRIVLIDPRATPGAGVAYAARDYPYPLNVAAGHMSLDGASPADFLEFA